MYQSRRPQYRNQTPGRYTARPAQAATGGNSLLYKKMTRKEFLATIAALLVGVLLFAFFEHHHIGAGHKNAVASSATSGATSNHAATPGDSFNKKQYSLTDPNS